MAFPAVIGSELPADELDTWLFIESNLHNLDRFAGELEDAVEIADFCDAETARLGQPIGEGWKRKAERRMQLSRWMSVAARSGAISIYNFAQTKAAIHELSNKSPTIAAGLDKDAQREAGRILDASFPNFARVRHSAGHAGEMAAKPEELKWNALKIGETTVFLNCNLAGRQFVSSVDGQEVSYNLTSDSVAQLRAVSEAMKRVFRPLAEATMKAFMVDLEEIAPGAQDG